MVSQKEMKLRRPLVVSTKDDFDPSLCRDFTEEEAKSYRESIDKLYKPLGVDKEGKPNLYCPLKFSARDISRLCDRRACAWYDVLNERCAIVSEVRR